MKSMIITKQKSFPAQAPHVRYLQQIKQYHMTELSNGITDIQCRFLHYEYVNAVATIDIGYDGISGK